MVSFSFPFFSLDIEAQTSSENSTATIKVDKINLTIENFLVDRGGTNLVEIKGDIKNNSTDDLHEIKIHAEYYDKNGVLLEKVDHFITSPAYILKPDKQVPFDITEVIAFNKLGDYKIVASGEPIS
ncbi:MAG TPA: FxLYD domain-containing protein [Nitrososphaeraceae archaeon]|nr:FxLYD domain-containing protein [Nitrososphaeraceae archaeon]